MAPTVGDTLICSDLLTSLKGWLTTFITFSISSLYIFIIDKLGLWFKETTYSNLPTYILYFTRSL